MALSIKSSALLSLIVALLSSTASSAAPKLKPGASLYANMPNLSAPKPVQLSLKSEAIINSDIVRLSDVIEGLDPAKDIPMFRAPDLGQIGTLQTSRILAAANENHISGIDTHDLNTVVVRRLGHLVPQSQILELVSDALSTRYGLPLDTDLVIDKTIKPLVVEADARRTPQLSSFYYDSRLSRFEASITIPGSEITAKSAYKIVGNLGEFVRVPIVIKDLNKGDSINANNIVIEKRKRVEIFGETPVDLTKVTGQIAKHNMRTGDIIGSTDILKAEWVERGSSVNIVFEAAGLSLSTKGKAITGGGEGDTISILNLQSKRQIEGIIIAPGKVSVKPANVQKTLADAAIVNRAASGTTPTRTAYVEGSVK